MRETLRVAAQSLASLVTSVVGEFFYGYLLVYIRQYILAYPAITTLIPVIANLRGGLYSTLASRASTRLHLGYPLKSLRDKWVIEQHLAIYTVKCCIVAYVSLIAALAARTRGISFTELFYATFTALSLAQIIMMPTTILLARESFRKGWDPDHVLTPIVALLGDATAIPTLLVAIIIYHKYRLHVILAIPLILLAINLAPIIYGFLKRAIRMQFGISTEIGVSLAISVAIEVVTGKLFTMHRQALVTQAYLLGALPVLMQAGGGVSSITASKMATELHVGTYPPRFTPSRRILWFALHNLIVYVPTYFISGLIGFASFLGTVGRTAIPYFIPAIKASMLIGLMVQPLILLFTHSLSVLAFKLKVDPDNTTIPILTALMDVSTVALVTLVIV